MITKLKHLIPVLLLALCILAAPAAAAGGAGTASNPYVIQTPAELQSMANDLSAYYVLGNDIDMTEYSYTPVGTLAAPFFGSFDGRGYTIKNMILDLPDTDYVGIFGAITSGTQIKNIVFEDCSIAGKGSVSLVYGRGIGASGITTPATINNIIATDCSVTGKEGLGILFGSNGNSFKGIITDCHAYTSSVIGTSNFIGGIVSFLANGGTTNVTINDCTINNCVVESNSGYFIGGIAGFLANAGSNAYGSAKNCIVNNCVVSGTYTVGGICGSLAELGSGYVSDCVVIDSTIRGSAYVGGIAGCKFASGYGSISGCSVANTTVQASSYAGGICPLFTR